MDVLTLHGIDRFEARKIIVAKLEELGLLEKIEPHVHQVPHGDRSDVVIEPWLTEQWYVECRRTGASPRSPRWRTGDTVFVPKNWEKTYFEWMRNIQPWCISRQLWWGHQIPAWYGPDGNGLRRRDRGRAAARSRAKAHAITASRRRTLVRATRTCSTPGSPRRCGRSPRWAGRTRRRNSSGTTRPTCWSPASTSSSSGSPA